jgi:hypothetical protein
MTYKVGTAWKSPQEMLYFVYRAREPIPHIITDKRGNRRFFDTFDEAAQYCAIHRTIRWIEEYIRNLSVDLNPYAYFLNALAIAMRKWIADQP